MSQSKQLNNQQARNVMITLNNPVKHGYDREKIISLIQMLVIVYACLCYEVGENGTEHVHMYICCKSPVRFQRFKNLFPEAHIETAYGSAEDNRNYITKTGKWANSEKNHTNKPETFWEKGVLPAKHESMADRNTKLITMVDEGMSNMEIVREEPTYALRLKDITALRQTVVGEKYLSVMRNVEVIYLYGPTGTGKTRSIYEKHDAKDICRITHYKSDGSIIFDAYDGQEVLVLEEFTGETDITFMLTLLDVYPLMLPARYNDKVACFTKVYIASNTNLFDLYKDTQCDSPKTWAAFLRRIDKVVIFNQDGTTTEEIVTKKTIINGGIGNDKND